MNSPSPLVPQGSNLEQQSKTRSSLKLKIFCALGVNVAVLLVLLMQGCKREQPAAPPEQLPVYTDTNPPPVAEIYTNPPSATVVDTNPVPVTPVPDTHIATQLPAGTAQEYTIQKGDTYFTIAPKFGVTAKAIQTANPTVDPAKLQIGKKIMIPAATTGATTSVGANTVVDTASGETTYTVKSGDTLGKLATEFHTTVKAIQSANGLTDTRIKVGQKLKIPGKTAGAPAPGQ
jgi:LysM repeat protein